MSTVPATQADAQSSSSAKAVIKQLSPLITMATTYLVRRAMISTYEKRTGQPAPLVYSRGPSVVRKVMWSAVMAGTVALIEVVILGLVDED